jgi:hypothetical protein
MHTMYAVGDSTNSASKPLDGPLHPARYTTYHRRNRLSHESGHLSITHILVAQARHIMIRRVMFRLLQGSTAIRKYFQDSYLWTLGILKIYKKVSTVSNWHLGNAQWLHCWECWEQMRQIFLCGNGREHVQRGRGDRRYVGHLSSCSYVFWKYNVIL